MKTCIEKIKGVNNYTKINLALKIILPIAILASLIGLFRDFNNTIFYGGVDLRSNVIGGRLLIEGIDPYYYIWSEGDPDLFLHPNANPNIPVGHVTVTPTVLVVYSLFAKLPYSIQKMIWFFLQWLFFILSLLIFSKSSKSDVRSKLIWIIGLLFISNSIFWRLHIERGKIIIFYVFMFALAYWIAQKSFKAKDALSGFILGFLVSLRPNYALIGIPVIIFKKWKIFIGMLIGCSFGLIIPLVFGNLNIWINYFTAMQIHSRIHAGIIEWGSFEYIRRSIEGMNELYLYAVLPIFDSSIQSIFANNLKISLSANASLISFIIILLIIVILLFKFKIKNITINLMFLTGILLTFISEFFLPVQRWDYFNIIWLPILSLIVINFNNISEFINPLIFLLFIGLIFSITSVRIFPLGLLISNVAMFIYLFIETLMLYSNSYKLEKYQ